MLNLGGGQGGRGFGPASRSVSFMAWVLACTDYSIWAAPDQVTRKSRRSHSPEVRASLHSSSALRTFKVRCMVG